MVFVAICFETTTTPKDTEVTFATLEMDLWDMDGIDWTTVGVAQWQGIVKSAPGLHVCRTIYGDDIISVRFRSNLVNVRVFF